MDAIIYTRVSKLVEARSDDQEPAGRVRSTADQEAECRAWCDREGHPVEAVYCDSNISASRFSAKDRPKWKMVTETLREGNILVVWEASRGYRDLEEWVALRNLCAERNVPLSYMGRVLNLNEGDDRFTGGLDALLAERESEQMRVRVLRGKRTAAAGGEFSGGKVPWGYRWTPGARPQEPGKLEPDPVEAPRVHEAVERILNGDSQYAVYKWLQQNEKAYTPSNPTNMRRALAKPTLAGLRTHQGEVAGKGTWEPIITVDQYQRLTGKFDRQKAEWGWAYSPGRPDPKYLLSGIAVCGRCDKPVRHVTRTKGKGKAYQCHHGHVSRLAAPIDEKVLKALFQVLEDLNAADFDTDDPQIASALSEIATLDRELEDWAQAAERREVTLSDYARMTKAFRDRKAQLVLLTEKPDDDDAEDILKNWDTYTLPRRREVIRKYLAVRIVPADEAKRNGGVNLVIDDRRMLR